MINAIACATIPIPKLPADPAKRRNIGNFDRKKFTTFSIFNHFSAR
jgi:hypothetical protein